MQSGSLWSLLLLAIVNNPSFRPAERRTTQKSPGLFTVYSSGFPCCGGVPLGIMKSLATACPSARPAGPAAGTAAHTSRPSTRPGKGSAQRPGVGHGCEGQGNEILQNGLHGSCGEERGYLQLSLILPMRLYSLGPDVANLSISACTVCTVSNSLVPVLKH